MAALAGGVAWLVLFVVFVALVRRNPRHAAADAPTARVAEPVVLGVGVAAFLVGVAALLLLVKQLVPG